MSDVKAFIQSIKGKGAGFVTNGWLSSSFYKGGILHWTLVARARAIAGEDKALTSSILNLAQFITPAIVWLTTSKDDAAKANPFPNGVSVNHIIWHIWLQLANTGISNIPDSDRSGLGKILHELRKDPEYSMECEITALMTQMPTKAVLEYVLFFSPSAEYTEKYLLGLKERYIRDGDEKLVVVFDKISKVSTLVGRWGYTG